jgi:hypothetical protein
MRVLLVLLGASEFPRRSDLSSPIFAASHVAVRDWLLDKAHGPMVEGDDCLDLFDSPRSWPDQEAELADWLKDRIATQPPPTDLLVHYVGHGGFRDESRDYYLAIRATRAENAFFSSIMVDSLWRTLRSGARRPRRFLIIDACFAAAAARALMAPLIEAVKVKVRALQEVEGAQAVRDVAVLPDRGTAVLCSSSAQDPANMAGAGGVTQFTDGLMQVLRAGSATTKDRLSLAQVHALVKASLSARYGENAVTPELHAPDQRLGLPQDVPLFPNLAPTKLGVTKGRVVQGRAQRFDSMANLAAQDPADTMQVAGLFDAEIDVSIRLKALRGLPPGPAVDPFLIKLRLKRAFAAAGDAVQAAAIVAEASDLVISALDQPPTDKYAYVIAPSELPNPGLSGLLDYWATVFDHACILGPRMVGALLLCAPRAVLSGDNSDIIALFKRLEAWK